MGSTVCCSFVVECKEAPFHDSESLGPSAVQSIYLMLPFLRISASSQGMIESIPFVGSVSKNGSDVLFAPCSACMVARGKSLTQPQHQCNQWHADTFCSTDTVTFTQWLLLLVLSVTLQVLWSRVPSCSLEAAQARLQETGSKSSSSKGTSNCESTAIAAAL